MEIKITKPSLVTLYEDSLYYTYRDALLRDIFTGYVLSTMVRKNGFHFNDISDDDNILLDEMTEKQSNEEKFIVCWNQENKTIYKIEYIGTVTYIIEK